MTQDCCGEVEDVQHEDWIEDHAKGDAKRRHGICLVCCLSCWLLLREYLGRYKEDGEVLRGCRRWRVGEHCAKSETSLANNDNLEMEGTA